MSVSKRNKVGEALRAALAKRVPLIVLLQLYKKWDQKREFYSDLTKELVDVLEKRGFAVHVDTSKVRFKLPRSPDVDVDLRQAGLDREHAPPGLGAAAFLNAMLARKTFRRQVVPAIADMQMEYAAAMAAGRKWYAKWMVARGYVYLLYGLVIGWLGARFGRRGSQ